MDFRDIRLLKLLEAVGSKQQTSQRALAKHLDVSLGLVNGFLQKLTCEGYCCVSNTKSKQKKYTLTSEGQAIKSRLTYDYILLSYKLFKEAQNKLIGFFRKLESAGQKRVIFYGINDFAEIAYLSLKKTSVKIVTVVDQEKAGGHFFNFIIEDPGVLSNYSFDQILITENSSYAMKIADNLCKDGFKDKVTILTA